MSKKCIAEGCENKPHARGYCQKHYMQIRRHGKLTGDRVFHTTCKVAGCANPHSGHGYCEMHLRRVRKYGTPSPTEKQRREARKVPELKPKAPKRKCRVPECKSPEKGRQGFCDKHIWRLRTHGSLNLPEKPEKPKAKCEVRGCRREAKHNGLCHTCYERERRYKKKLVAAKIERQKLIDQGINVCRVETCPHRAHSKGLCSTHRKRRDKGQSLTDAPSSTSTWQAEIFLEAAKLYGKEKVRNNDRTVIKNPETSRPLELDVSVRKDGIVWLAVEINGRAHYEPIFGKENLAKQRHRDEIKKKICREKGIKLLVVKTGERPRWPEKEQEN